MLQERPQVAIAFVGRFDGAQYTSAETFELKTLACSNRINSPNLLQVHRQHVRAISTGETEIHRN